MAVSFKDATPLDGSLGIGCCASSYERERAVGFPGRAAS